jgi:hypothetical protein
MKLKVVHWLVEIYVGKFDQVEYVNQIYLKTPLNLEVCQNLLRAEELKLIKIILININSNFSLH